MSETILYPPGEVAKRLDVSSSGLRRLALIYAEVYGDLPRDHAGTRMWPQEAVARLETARALVAAGRAGSIKDALGAVDEGVTAQAGEIARVSSEGALGALIEEVRALREKVEALESKSDTLSRQLEAPKDDTRTAEVERMNAYLLGELERRSQEEVPVKRPWWRFWG